jgi:YidC/Oxa1 family membrane protein insertase
MMALTWVLSIVGLVLVVRAALIPHLRQADQEPEVGCSKSRPQLKKIQDKYKGKKDQFSREAMSRETMDLYKKTGTNPLSSCLPLLLQMPIFFGLFSVLQHAQNQNAENPGGRRPAERAAVRVFRQLRPVGCSPAPGDQHRRRKRHR